MSNFITNAGNASLKSRLVTLIRESQELKILVGFFYFSGIFELVESLRLNPDLPLKILVGHNVNANPLPDKKGLNVIVFPTLGLTDHEIKALHAGLLELTASKQMKARTFT